MAIKSAIERAEDFEVKIPYVPIDHEVHGYRIVEIEGQYPRRYHVIKPNGTRLTGTIVGVPGVGHYGAALKLIEKHRRYLALDEME